MTLLEKWLKEDEDRECQLYFFANSVFVCELSNNRTQRILSRQEGYTLEETISESLATLPYVERT